MKANTKLIFKGTELLSVIFILILIFQIIQPSWALTGYDITAKVDGQAWEIHRSTQNLSFNILGNVSGVGNFSRLSHIDKIAGITAEEKSSCTRNGSISYLEKLNFRTVEGPVIITITAKDGSKEITIPDETVEMDSEKKTILKESSAEINIDERWPVFLVNYKKILYKGKGMRTSEYYDNDGNVVSTYIDSWKLSKESLFRTFSNRTVTDIYISPSVVIEKKGSNKTTNYKLNLDTTGSRTSLDILKFDPQLKELMQISQDYGGHQKIMLNVNMNESVRTPPDPESWIPCCFAGYSDMSETDRKYLGADDIFNCNCSQKGACALQ
jgi:hypothetical protein